MDHPNRASLLGLPAELRLQIYHHVWPPLTNLPREALVGHHEIYVSQFNFKTRAALLQVNQLIRNEAQDPFYTNNSFFAVINANRCDKFLRFLRAIGPENVAAITDIFLQFRIPHSAVQIYEQKNRQFEATIRRFWTSTAESGMCPKTNLLKRHARDLCCELPRLEERFTRENERALVDFAKALPVELGRYSIRGNLQEHSHIKASWFLRRFGFAHFKLGVSERVVRLFEQELAKQGFDFFRNCEILRDGERAAAPANLKLWKEKRPWSWGDNTSTSDTAVLTASLLNPLTGG
ncbi:uncharacterized protein MYCFIDRAFT_197259 [Pseudocercospora fijiensis CIRAD86]|uniref:Uncharacterized protein n=1 Tax=Pseudocercospora fijiensis (strain CIRAD86) TaxID=383855 RepID=M3AXY8_PSEFD|nr:uncharacterized protein MYCFIDRAFT_197259 [Pseudocercospora fijiensis CIRAD86]EME82013.1 hypothetical protein MYCFIDRAFT_197259 [Pseudocercospora fijiensis CIRAD86]